MYTVKRTVEDYEPYYYILLEVDGDTKTVAECWDSEYARKITHLLNTTVEV